jgi:hexosaminidase
MPNIPIFKAHQVFYDMRIFILLIGWSLFISSCNSVQNEQQEELDLAILPLTQNLEYLEERYELPQRFKLYAKKELQPSLELLSDYLKDLGLEPELQNERPETALVILELNPEISDNPEAYELWIKDGKIRLVGATAQGLGWAIQSLRQLLLQQEMPYRLRGMEIKDAPKFAWRGLLLDCSRHFMEKDFVKRYIDLLALHKMNRLHWHLTEDQGWRIEIKQYPKLTEVGAWRDDGNGGKYGGFYTQEEIKEVVAYAEKRGVLVVPEIELPGHAQAALAAYPQHSCTGGPFEVETEWGVFKEIYCAGDDSTFIFLENILTEVLALFPSPYIHIGGDEVPKYRWENCPKCQNRIKTEGLQDEHELQSYFIQRIGDFLASKNRKLIGWDEILEGGLAEGAIVQSWRGFDGAKAAIKEGHPAIVSPTSHAYFDYGLNDIDLEKVYSFNPIPEGSSSEEAALVLGGECNMWSERAPQDKVDSKVFPRILAMAELLWSGPKKRSFSDFKTGVQTHYAILDKLEVNYGLETVPVTVKTALKEGQLFVHLLSADSNQTTFYRVNNSGKVRYSNPFKIDSSANLSIEFERKGKKYEEKVEQKIQAHLANGIRPKLSYEYHQNYSAGGPEGLTDGKLGSSNFKDGNWQGCWGDDMEVLVDLGESKTINYLESGFLQYNNAWIFFPQKVEYWGSEDGKNYEPLGVVKNQSNPKEKKQFRQAFQLELKSQKFRYIKMKAYTLGICPEWHDAAGSKAWLFMDELIII